jgi:hypothetical protein
MHTSDTVNRLCCKNCPCLFEALKWQQTFKDVCLNFHHYVATCQLDCLFQTSEMLLTQILMAQTLVWLLVNDISMYILPCYIHKVLSERKYFKVWCILKFGLACVNFCNMWNKYKVHSVFILYITKLLKWHVYKIHTEALFKYQPLFDLP